jgi:hypothetical protein
MWDKYIYLANSEEHAYNMAKYKFPERNVSRSTIYLDFH